MIFRINCYYAEEQTIFQHTIPKRPRTSSTSVPTATATAETIVDNTSLPSFFIVKKGGLEL